MTPELLSSMAGAILSLLASYVPGLNTAYDRLSPTAKRLVMAALVTTAAVVSAAWSCSSPDTEEALDVCMAGAEWRVYAQSIIAALVANQATHRISPGDTVTVRTPKPRKRRKPSSFARSKKPSPD